MDSTQRQRLISSSIETAVSDNEEIEIFEDQASGKFVQFTIFASERTLILDIPLNGLSNQKYEWLSQHMEIMTGSNNEPISFQKSMSTVQIEYAAQYTEWILNKIFQLPDSYIVMAKVFT